MRDNGYTLQVEDNYDPVALKGQYNIPVALQSCHTAIVDGYIIEGHVPVADVERLLAEKTDVLGLAVPGMPAGSPGMEAAGVAPQPYNVIAFDAAGNTTVFASYNQ